MRGTPFELFVFELNFQITPACAGNTITPTSANCLFTDHPRLCGEHRIFQGFQVLVTGSPPPVRGTPQEPRFDPVKVRITPACAGNTCGQPMPGCITKDHPRLCGEHSVSARIRSVLAGSPPPVRGTPHVVNQRGMAIGITPACAGNTYTTSSCLTLLVDHPRMCGEHLASSTAWRRSSGSPPPVRGTLY